MYGFLTSLARDLPTTSADRRTLHQRRADVLTDLILAPEQASAAAGSGASARRGEVAVVIPLAVLLGGDDSTDPAELAGCGPIPGPVARALAADRRWRMWITDSAGTVLAASPRTYTPTAAVARVVRAREPHCRMPGCRSARVDLDHVTPWPDGDTVPANLAALCRRHHNLKTHHRWRLRNLSPPEPEPNSERAGRHRPVPPDSFPCGFTWTDPTGITHTDHH